MSCVVQDAASCAIARLLSDHILEVSVPSEVLFSFHVAALLQPGCLAARICRLRSCEASFIASEGLVSMGFSCCGGNHSGSIAFCS